MLLIRAIRKRQYFSVGRDVLTNCVCCVPEPLSSTSLSKHLPSSDSMSLKVDVEALENSPGATYIRKKGGKVTGDNQPKEQG